MKNRNRFLAVSMMVVMMFVIFLGNQVYASGGGILDRLEIVGKKETYNPGDSITIKGEWSIPDDTMDKVYMAGDGFSISVPEGLDLNIGSIRLGEYGEGIYDPVTRTINFLFNEEIQGRINRKGGFKIALTIAGDLEEGKKPIVIENEKGDIVLEDEIVVEAEKDGVIDGGSHLHPKPVGDKKVWKHGYVNPNDARARWIVRVNYDAESIGEVSVKDVLGPDHKILLDTFTVKEQFTDGYRHNPLLKVNGKDTIYHSLDSLIGEVTEKGYDLRLNLKDYGSHTITVDDDPSDYSNNYLQKTLNIRSFYTIEYYTVYTGDADENEAVTLTNDIMAEDDGGSREVPAKVELQEGWARGDQSYRPFKLLKLDSKTNQPVAGAEFSLKHKVFPANPPIKIVTDEDGIGWVDNLLTGLYDIEEIKTPNGYKSPGRLDPIWIDFKDNSIFEYKLTNEPVLMDISVNKLWKDMEGNEINDLTKVPDIIVNLIGRVGDKEVISRFGKIQSGTNKMIFKDLPEYYLGEKVEYDIQEVPDKAYVQLEKISDGDDFTIINEFQPPTPEEPPKEEAPKLVDISISKEWFNSDGEEIPDVDIDEINIILISPSGEEIALVLTKEDNWEKEVKGLEPEGDNEYQIKELEVPGYDLAKIDRVGDKFIIQNKETLEEPPTPEEPELVDISISKEWFNSDGEEISDVDIDEINIILISPNGEEIALVLTKEDNWEKEVKGLEPEGDNKYQIKELEVPGYDLAKIDRVGDKFIIQNKENTEGRLEGFVDLSIEKEWLDSEGNKLSDLEVDSIDVLVTSTDGYNKTISLSKENNWKADLKNLDLLDENNDVITYTVEEKTKVRGFELVKVEDDGYNFTLVNREEPPVTPEEPELVDLSIAKKWIDRDGAEISELEVDEIEAIVEGSNGYSKTISLSKANDWKYELTGLDKFDGKDLVEYRVVEKGKIKGFKLVDVEKDGYNFTLVNGEEDPPVTPEEEPELVDLSIVKKWVDEEDDELSQVTVDEIQVIIEGSNGYSKELTISEKNNWRAELLGLQEVDEDGEKIKYSIRERSVEDYQVVGIERDGDTFTITNRKKPEEPTKPNKPNKPNKPKDPEPKDPENPEPTDPNEPEERPEPEDPEEEEEDPVVPDNLSGFNEKEIVRVEGKNQEEVKLEEEKVMEEVRVEQVITTRGENSVDVLPKTGENRNANYIFGMLFIVIGIFLRRKY